MKISEEDLEKLFDSDQIEFGPEEGWKGFEVNDDKPSQSAEEIIKIKKISKKLTWP